MKFLTFVENDGNKEKIGLFNLNEDKIYEVSSLLNRKIDSMIDLIRTVSENELKILKEKIKYEDSNFYRIKDVKIFSPIRKPIHDIICVGLNYYEHILETKEHFISDIDENKKTVYFSKRSNEIIGTNDFIRSRMDLDKELDYEVELAVIIGKKGKDISEEKAEEYIFGYSIFNDISARKLQKEHLQWYRGKSLDTFSVMGPVILHKDDIKFPINLEIVSKVNGEIRQQSNTEYMIKNISKIISEISEGITLEAGDIIITGTPAGVALGHKNKEFLKIGDVIECEISSIGLLRNQVI